MAATRLTRTSTPSRHPVSSSYGCSSFSSANRIRCLNPADTRAYGNNGYHNQIRKSSGVAIKAATSNRLMITTKREVDRGIDISTLLATVTDAVLKLLIRPVVKKRAWNWKFQIQSFIEKAIINCRFFTFLAVAGSLLGSVLCFAEGCVLLLESYLKFFSTLSQKTAQAHIMHLLIEAIDMFLVGTALLVFGVGLYAMFVGSDNLRGESPQLPASNLFGLFYLKKTPKWMEMESISQAKSRIGHAVMMILQVGVLEKFTSIPVVTSLDLVCFAGAVLLSSGCIFLLSRLSISRQDDATYN